MNKNIVFCINILFVSLLLYKPPFLEASLCDFLTMPKHFIGYDEFCNNLYKPLTNEEIWENYVDHTIYIATGPTKTKKGGMISRFSEIGHDHPILRHTGAIISVAAAWGVHITSHELGHHFAAKSFGATNSSIRFFYKNPDDNKFYLGMNQYTGTSDENRGSIAIAGYAAEQWIYNFAFELEKTHPSTFGKALMFFSTANFVGYTLYANLKDPDNCSLDPNAIRKVTGLSKTTLTTIVFSKAAINTYKAFNKDFPVIPEVFVEEKSFGIKLHFPF